jgi:hypothetical protein
MTGSPDGEEPPGRPALTARPHEPTQPGRPGQSPPPPGTDLTQTLTGAGAGPAAAAPRENRPDADGGSPAGNGRAQVMRYGPGVPAAGPASRPVPTAEQVWQTGLPNAPGRPRRRRRLAGPVLSVALIVASGVVIYLRLHHGPFGVTGVAITQQVRKGCTEDVTGRVDMTGAAGTVSYQWLFAPQLAAAQRLSQSVASGQSVMYVTAAVEGQGHGILAQTVTLRVLGPGHDSASAHIVLSC